MRFLDAGGTDATAGERLATALGEEPPRPPAASSRSSPRAPQGDPADGDGPGAPPERWGALRRLLESGRADPGLPGARALIVAGIGAALVAGGCLWLSRPHPEPAPVSGRVSAPVSAGVASLAVPADAPGRGPGAAGPAAASPPVVVHVAGRVRSPGVVTLPPGARVTDAIKAAGGVRPGAGTGTLNLARKVVDGEQILVGVPGAPAAPAGPAAAGGPDPGGGDPAAALDLNAATSEQIQRLPGVGPVLAQRIIDFRTQQGGFRAVEDLRQVSGIGARRFADLKERVRV
ncbi:MAG: competence protein ComEA helix-hairpin-helix repeat protein [Streptosporangiaceae bacterium]|jgi:competence protein ComEA|nr:competence protein ComEA helix-hairpin-helix repeat protein [Streptosporangiaceae bacterium]